MLLAGRIHARAAELVGDGRTTEAVLEGREALAAYRDIALTGLEVDHIAVARERANLERLFEARGLLAGRICTGLVLRALIWRQPLVSAIGRVQP